jgi:hypothetical protein
LLAKPGDAEARHRPHARWWKREVCSDINALRAGFLTVHPEDNVNRRPIPAGSIRYHIDKADQSTMLDYW